jgi:hypothetical protein
MLNGERGPSIRTHEPRGALVISRILQISLTTLSRGPADSGRRRGGVHASTAANYCSMIIALIAVMSSRAAAQTVHQPPVVLPRIEVSASVSVHTEIRHAPQAARLDRTRSIACCQPQSQPQCCASRRSEHILRRPAVAARRRAIAHGFLLRQQPRSGAGPIRRQRADRIGRSGQRDVTPGHENRWSRRRAPQASARHGSALGSRLPHRAVRKGPPRSRLRGNRVHRWPAPAVIWGRGVRSARD